MIPTDSWYSAKAARVSGPKYPVAPTRAPTGYLKENRLDRKCEVIIDPDRAPVVKKMFEKVAYEKWSGRQIYFWLKSDLNFKSNPSGKHLTLSNVYMILQNHFYYGSFEYPRKSGVWYTGRHQPLITKELFDAVQEQVKRQSVRAENKEFAFTKLMTCGFCGSGITADEKFKKHKNGNVHRYVYYGCTKTKDRACKGGYVNETDLIGQFEALMDKIDLDETGIKTKLRSEIERMKKFQKALGGNSEKIEVKDIDIRNYAKHLLREGTIFEKRELLSCFRNQMLLKDREILLGLDDSIL